MRLLDVTSQKALKSAIVYLTQEEAEELRDRILALLEETPTAHYHIYSQDYQKELTICVYREDDLVMFDERSKRLIRDDE